MHVGNIEKGHYIAYTKRYSNWYLFNDEQWEQVSESHALKQEAYLLFYKKMETIHN